MKQDAETISLPQALAPDIPCRKYINGRWEQKTLSVPKEIAFTIYINNQELVTILCTPFNLNCLVLGYLASEGIITEPKDVASMRVCEEDALADVKLNGHDFLLPQKRILKNYPALIIFSGNIWEIPEIVLPAIFPENPST